MKVMHEFAYNPTRKDSCQHQKHQMSWFLSGCNEKGWKCECGFEPGEPAGFSPLHDHHLIEIKVMCILGRLHDEEFIYISNGTEGDFLVGCVANKCAIEGIYDQQSIIRFILEEVADADHVRFWKDISDGVRAGRDPRDRCKCGNLANMHWNKNCYCDECSPLRNEKTIFADAPAEPIASDSQPIDGPTASSV